MVSASPIGHLGKKAAWCASRVRDSLVVFGCGHPNIHLVEGQPISSEVDLIYLWEHSGSSINTLFDSLDRARVPFATYAHIYILCIVISLEIQDQTKWLVFGMIYGARIPDPTYTRKVWSTWTSWVHFLGSTVLSYPMNL